MNKLFDSVPKSGLPRNRFDLTHDRKLTLGFGTIIPILCTEALPGDSINLTHELLVRCAPLISPAYARLKVKCETHFVPTRIIWDDYEEAVTGGVDGLQNHTWPYFNNADLQTASAGNLTDVGSLWDHMGLPTADDTIGATGVWPKISSLPFRALAQVYNDWYRIPGINTEIDFLKTSGAETKYSELLTMRKRNWSRDMFTTAQPNAQRGAAAAAPIDVEYSATSTWKTTAGAAIPNAVYPQGTGVTTNLHTSDGGTSRIENLSGASLLIENLRISLSVQKFLEAMSRGGSRLTEYLKQIWNRKSQDSRLQRAEFITGSTGNIQISEVLSSVQFEGASTDLPQGNMAGHGLHLGTSNPARYTAPEAGFFITVMSIVPSGGAYGSGHCSGVHKMWQRFDKFDQYLPQFANLGEQALHVKEIACNPAVGSTDLHDLVFGYVPRWSEYKWIPSTVHGTFRTSNDFWTVNRGWTPVGDPNTGDYPKLNNEFLQVGGDANFIEEGSLERIFAVPNVDHFYVLAINHLSMVRPMPYNTIPGI